jgi:hypothetical protein
MELLGRHDRTWGLKTLNYALKMTWGGQHASNRSVGFHPIRLDETFWSNRSVAGSYRSFGFIWQKMINMKVVDFSLSFPWPWTGGQTKSVCSSYGQNGKGVSGTTSLPIILRFSLFSSFLSSFSFLHFILESLEWQLHDFYLLEYIPRDFHLSGILRTCINLRLLIISSSFSSFSFHEPKIRIMLN